MAEQVVGLDGRRVAGDLDGVAAQAAEDAGLDVGVRGLDVERVVALHAVDHEPLDVDVGDEPAGAVDAVGW